MKNLKSLLNALVVICIISSLHSCKEKEDNTTPNQQSTTPKPTPQPVEFVPYAMLNADTCFNPTVSKYQLSTGSYVINARGKNDQPNIYIYFKGAEPAAGSKFTLVDNRKQNNLLENEAFVRYYANGQNYYSTYQDTLEIETYKDKKILRLRKSPFALEDRIQLWDCSIKIIF